MNYKKITFLKNFTESVEPEEPYETSSYGIPLSALNHTLHIVANYPEGGGVSLSFTLLGSINCEDWFELYKTTNPITNSQAIHITDKLVDFVKLRIDELTITGEDSNVSIYYIGR